MTEVVALTGGDADDQVMRTAAAVGQVARAEVRQVSIARGLNAGQAAREALRELHGADVVLGVLASDMPSEPLWRRVIQASTKPVILVSAAARDRPPSIRLVLVPLDGTPESAVAVTETVRQFAQAGVEIVVLHVFTAATVPRFWDQAAHAHQSWSEEFLARNCARSGARLELRRGVPGEAVVDVAAREDADLIVLGWSRHLRRGRARTVRRIVVDSATRVMLVPMGRPNPTASCAGQTTP